jgi:hypothetical protein
MSVESPPRPPPTNPSRARVRVPPTCGVRGTRNSAETALPRHGYRARSRGTYSRQHPGKADTDPGRVKNGKRGEYTVAVHSGGSTHILNGPTAEAATHAAGRTRPRPARQQGPWHAQTEGWGVPPSGARVVADDEWSRLAAWRMNHSSSDACRTQTRQHHNQRFLQPA